MPTTVSPNKPGLDPQVPQPRRINAASRRRIGAAVFILALSAVVFCMAVVRQRDVRLKQLSMSRVQEVESWIRDYYDSYGFLPTSLPADRDFFDGNLPNLGYPEPRQVPLLNQHDGAILLIAAPKVGIISPGGDGFAALVFENGQFHSEWISPQQLLEMRKARRDLLAGF